MDILEQIVEALGETNGKTMGKGRKWLRNWGNITFAGLTVIIMQKMKQTGFNKSACNKFAPKL